MGKSGDSDRFRLLVCEKLFDKVTIVEKPDDAEIEPPARIHGVNKILRLGVSKTPAISAVAKITIAYLVSSPTPAIAPNASHNFESLVLISLSVT